MSCRVTIGAGACFFAVALAFGGYNDLGPYTNSESNEFWNLRHHSAVDVSESAGVCSSATFDPRSFARVYAHGCDVRFEKPGLMIIFR